jgi:hypothetical protein
VSRQNGSKRKHPQIFQQQSLSYNRVYTTPLYSIMTGHDAVNENNIIMCCALRKFCLCFVSRQGSDSSQRAHTHAHMPDTHSFLYVYIHTFYSMCQHWLHSRLRCEWQGWHLLLQFGMLLQTRCSLFVSLCLFGIENGE